MGTSTEPKRVYRSGAMCVSMREWPRKMVKQQLPKCSLQFTAWVREHQTQRVSPNQDRDQGE
jgi:hypothetical protein